MRLSMKVRLTLSTPSDDILHSYAVHQTTVAPVQGEACLALRGSYVCIPLLKKNYPPKIIQHFYLSSFQLDRQEVGVRAEHQSHVLRGPPQGINVILHLFSSDGDIVLSQTSRLPGAKSVLKNDLVDLDHSVFTGVEDSDFLSATARLVTDSLGKGAII